MFFQMFLQRIGNFYDNGFYYPNLFLFVLLLCFLTSSLLLFLLIKVICSNRVQKYFAVVFSRKKRIDDNLSKIFKRNFSSVIIILLLLTVLSRFSISYTGTNSVLSPPGKIFEAFLGRDFTTCVYGRTLRMINGRPMNTSTVNSACGQAFPLVLAPFLLTIKMENHMPAYEILLFTTVIGYLVFIYVLTIKSKQDIRNNMLLIFIIFLLGTPGSFGIINGNVDIFLSLVFGFFILILFGQMKHKSPNTAPLSASIFLGILMGFMVNAKIFLFPFAFFSLFFSRYFFISLLSWLISFWGLVYLPNIFGSTSNYQTFSLAILNWTAPLFADLQSNHSIRAVSTLFTDCLEKQNCDQQIAYIPILIIFFFVFVLPVWMKLLKEKIKFKMLIKKIPSIFLSSYSVLREERNNKRLFIFFLILSDAIINLIPKIAYDYRLFYSLPILFVLLLDKKSIKAVYYSYLSILFLLLGGLWIFTDLQPRGMNIFESRGMSMLIILHFYFFIRAGLEDLKFNSRVVQLIRLKN